ncbi:MAG: tetratricopeptide repeat protein [Planctomycetota bacterium]|nr:tetratricopeptide repeat protein [Planctomycetota bacterium]
MRGARITRFAAALALACAALLVRAEDAPPPSLFDEALRISKEFDPEVDLDSCRKLYQELLAGARRGVEVLKAKWDGTPPPEEYVRVLNNHILVNRNVSYISNKYWRDSVFTSALTKGKGNCLSTALLYHFVAQDLKLPIQIVFLPEHALARWDDGKTRFNIETTSNGRIVQDAEILAHFELTKADLEENGFLTSGDPAVTRAILMSTWAEVLSSMGRREEGLKLTRAALALSPGSAVLRMDLAEQQMYAGRTEEAEKTYREVLAQAKAPWCEARAASALAYYLEARGRIDDALAVLEKHFLHAPAKMKLRMLTTLGELYRHKRDFEKAIQVHQLQVKLDPDEDSYNNLGSVLTEAHRDAEAIAAYEKALAYNPESFFTQVILAGLYERSGDKAKGRAYFATIEEPRDDKITWYCALVWYYANIKEEGLMTKNMEKALALDGSGHVYHYFVREPDLDPYRKNEAFAALMKKHAPAAAEERKSGEPAAP